MKKNKLTDIEIEYINNLYSIITIKELFDKVNSWRTEENKFKFTTFRMQLYEHNLTRYKKTKWSPAEVSYLKNNYQKIGDTELAIELNKLFKNRKFTKKRVEKKRRYLKLKRTSEEVHQIRQEHIRKGNYTKGHNITAAARRYYDGKIVERKICGRKYLYIKHDGKFIDYRRYIWELKKGTIPPKMKIFSKDNHPSNNLTIDNFYIALKSNKSINKKRIA